MFHPFKYILILLISFVCVRTFVKMATLYVFMKTESKLYTIWTTGKERKKEKKCPPWRGGDGGIGKKKNKNKPLC